MDATTSAGQVFVGRERELADLRSGLEEASAGRGRLILLAGEPGIGKSRLADEFMTRARDAGARVLSGRCWEAGGAPPYWPWVQVIRAHLRSEDAAAVRSDLSTGAGDVAQMLPEIAEIVPDLVEPPSLDPDSARFRLFDATTAFLRAASARIPLVVLLEDMHAADTASMLLLRFLAGQLADSRILVLGTYRDVELAPDHPLTQTISELAREPGTLRLDLRGLDDAEVMRFIEAVAGVEPKRSLASALRTSANGNPLFLGEAVRLLQAEGRLGELSDLAAVHIGVPRQIRDVISKRAGHLGEACRELIGVASVLGPEFSVDALTRVATTATDPLGLLAEAEREGLIQPLTGSPGRYRFAHDLIRQTFYSEFDPTRRTHLHLRAAEVLEELYAGDPDPFLAELAHHFFEAGSDDSRARAVTYARRAGERAIESLAYEEAARMFAMAVHGVERDEQPDDGALVELLLALGDTQARAGDLIAAQRTFLRGASIARRIGDSRHLATAALGYGGRFVWARAGADEHLVPLLQDALALLGGEDDRLRVRLLSRLACALRSEPDRERGAALSQQAVDMAERLGDPATLAYALDGRFGSIWWPENAAERLAIGERLARIAEEAGDVERVASGTLAICLSYADLGQIDRAKTELSSLERRARELRQPAQGWLVGALRAQFALLEGRFQEVEELIERATSVGPATPVRDHVSVARFQTYLLRREQGRGAEIEESVRAAAEEFSWYPLHRGALASLLVDLDRRAEAQAILTDLIRSWRDLVRDNEWLPAACLVGEVCARLGDTASARVVYDDLLPFAGAHAVGHAEGSLGSVDRYLGLLAGCLAEVDDAEQHLSSAIDGNARLGARPWVAHSEFELAELLLARQPVGDRARARALLRDAHETCDALGMRALGAKVAALTEEPRGPASEPTTVSRSSEFRREGEYWTVVFEQETARLRDSKGLAYVARLLERPGKELHVLDLVSGGGDGLGRSSATVDGTAPGGWGDAGAILDERAKAEYRQRIRDIEDELDEARDWNDPERESRAREELEFFTKELAGAVGLGGRDRKAASASERARVNVTRAIKAAMERLAEATPTLAEHLRATIRTGTFCVYEPDPRVETTWRL